MCDAAIDSYRPIRFGKKWILREFSAGDKNRLSRKRLSDDLLDAIEEFERQFNQAQLVWSLRCKGLGISEIEAELRGYPPDMRLTHDQLRYFFNPGKWKLRSRRRAAKREEQG